METMTILDGLTDDQKEVVSIVSGRHLVLAPPGTGKTEMLTRRVVKALADGVPKDRMFCGTFTIRAATEMRTRVAAATRLAEKDLPEIGNIHHFCNRFLHSRQIVPQARQVVDEVFVREMVSDCISDFADELVDADDDAADTGLFDWIKKLFRNAMKKPLDPALKKWFEDFEGECAKSKRPIAVETFTRLAGVRERRAGVPERLCSVPEPKNGCEKVFLDSVLRRYDALKDSLFVLDFDDLLIETYKHLSAGGIADEEKFRWVQVDEVQDLNPLQWEIVELSTSPDAAMLFFGDYEQSIFSFMGASLNILDRKADTCRPHFFRKNFRATSYLLDLLTRYSFKVLDSRFAFVPEPAVLERGSGNLVRDEYIFPVTYYYSWAGDRRIDHLGTKYNRGLAMGKHVGRYCDEFLRSEAALRGERIAVLVQRNADADVIADHLGIDGVVRFSGQEYSQTAVFRNANALFEVVANPFSRPGWSRLFLLFGGKENVPNRAAARVIAGELFGLCLNPGDLLAGEGDLSASAMPLRRYAEYAKSGRIVVFDTETTGLDTRNDEIIQLSAAEYVNGRLGRSLDIYLKCGRPIPPEAEAVHHISQRILDEKGVDPCDGIRRFLAFVGTDSLLVAHNLRFDRAMLINGCKLHDIAFDPDAIEMCDSLALVRRLHPKFPKFKLGYLLDKLGLEGNNSHNAMDDVWAAGSLMLHLASEGAEYADRQQAWLNENWEFVRKFRENFSGYYADFLERIKGRVSMRDEILRLCAYVDRINSVPEDRATSTVRLNHFFSWTDERYSEDGRSLEEIIVDEWQDVSRMKEADLLTESDRVIVSTVHKAKGLQFHTVIIPDADDYPSYYASQSQEGIEESKRLLYVAMSRAKRKLVVSNGVGIDEANDCVEPAYSGATKFVNPVGECFDEGFVDIFCRAAEGEDLSQLAETDWMARQLTVAGYVASQVCPPDVDEYIASPIPSIGKMGVRSLKWMDDEDRRRELLAGVFKTWSAGKWEAASLVIAATRDTTFVRTLRGVAARTPLACGSLRRAVFDALEALSAESSALVAIGDLIYDPEGWMRREAARVLAANGNASWCDILKGDDADWERLEGVRDQEQDKVIAWKIKCGLPTACDRLRRLAEKRGISIA